jgi:hypothetical protein
MNMVPRHPFNEMKPNSGGNPDGTLFAHSKKPFRKLLDPKEKPPIPSITREIHVNAVSF